MTLGRLPDLLIFTEASPVIGHGHVARCMALADEALRRGLKVQFSVQGAYTANILEMAGYSQLQDQGKAVPYIIRDFRGGSPEEEVRRQCMAGSKVMLIDDHGAARTVASIVTDAFMTPASAQVLEHAHDVEYLYGLKYAPLRRQFLERKPKKKKQAKSSGHLCIAFGGRDPSETTQKFLSALTEAGFRGPATVVVDGSSGERNNAVELTSLWQDTEIHQQVTDMASLMSKSDLVVTKIGVTLLESYCLGLGCALIEPTWAHVELEADLAKHYKLWPAVEFGLAEKTDFLSAAIATIDLLAHPNRTLEIGRHALSLVDGRGVIRLVDNLTC